MAGLPPPPTSSTATASPVTENTEATTTAAADAAEAADTTAKAIKQFGPSEDEDGNPIPVPLASNVDLTKVLPELHSSLVGILAKFEVTDVDSFIEELEAIDKTKYPGNKAGRVSYSTGNLIIRIRKEFDILTKQRGASTVSAKAKIAEKDNQIAELTSKLARLEALLGGK